MTINGVPSGHVNRWPEGCREAYDIREERLMRRAAADAIRNPPDLALIAHEAEDNSADEG